MDLEDYLAQQFRNSNTLNRPIWSLLKLRISQINQCAFCIDMHSKELENAHETHQRMMGLSAWRDMPFYTEIERIVLNWGERLTLGQPIDDNEYQSVLQSLGEMELVDLTIAINASQSCSEVSASA